MDSTSNWQFWVDRGGTFTDVVARRPDGSLQTTKLLSENASHYQDAAVEGIRQILSGAGVVDIDAEHVDAVKMGTTVATNALLERKGELVALAVSAGFRDSLRIAYQNRPKLFEREIVLPELLYRHVFEVDERIGVDGSIVKPLDREQCREQLQRLFDQGVRCLAVVLMHGYRFDEHEKVVGQMAREIGFEQISLSHQVSPLIKYVARGDTTVVDAYLSPVLRRYVEQVAAAMPGVRLQFMRSNGGLTDAHSFQGKDSILSGPAGGIVGMSRVSKQAGFAKVIGFDMGGTSTDVSHYAGEFERVFDTLVAGVRMRAPMMSIHTIAAGGGSVLHFDGAKLRVGPDSAGANPGPACYRRGGPLTVTDANVMLGKIQPNHFPAVFGEDGEQAIDREIVQLQFAELTKRVKAKTGRTMSPEQVAQGFIDIAVANMANAIKKISIQRGYDVTRYTLTTFGGAGGQHACLVADELGMDRVLVHPLAGVLSAYGMGLAEQTAMRERSVEMILGPRSIADTAKVMAQLVDSARAELISNGEDPETINVECKLLLRYQGTDTALLVAWGDLQDMQAQFDRRYRTNFAFLMPDRDLVIESVVVEALGVAGEGLNLAPHQRRQGELTADGEARLFALDHWHSAPLYRREQINPDEQISGPAVVVEQTATTVVEPGWRATMTDRGDLVLDRVQARPDRHALGTTANPILLEIFNNLFMSIAEQMGFRLQNTAHSVNIKERLDFSCAIFDVDGALVANAPHMPIHLGSMGASVRAIITSNRGRVAVGDVFALNDPYAGGTHLPDVTVITPVFDHSGDRLLFWVGSRGHHADIGGVTPGSMPPNSQEIEDEGVMITNFRLVENGEMREQEFRDLLNGATYPARNPEQNIADLRAQIAANEKGREELLNMLETYGVDVVMAYMGHVQDNAEESVRRVVSALSDGRFTLKLDNGAQINVAIRVDRSTRSAVIDFSGTSSQQRNNFNAPSAVSMAAVLYVFRTLVDEDIPMNEGCLKPLQVIIPKRSMLSPEFPAAVVAGNVETSTCIVNALYGALGIMGSSQPTINNFTFGDARYQYYETISGGSGAGGRFDPSGRLLGGFNGCSVVQTHITNSRMTDPEILELRFPVRLERFEILANTGGEGRWRGGDGAIRQIRFLQPMTASILSNGRVQAAFGSAGGLAGKLGRNRVIRSNGEVVELGSTDKASLQAGDQFVIETPGGGGFGPKPG